MKTAGHLLLIAIASVSFAQSAPSTAASHPTNTAHCARARGESERNSAKSTEARGKILKKPSIHPILPMPGTVPVRRDVGALQTGTTQSGVTKGMGGTAASSFVQPAPRNMRHRGFNPPFVGGPTAPTAGKGGGISGNGMKRRP